MSTEIVQTSEFVTLVGAGPVNTGILNEALTFAPYLIAVDGGAELLRKYGKSPEIVIGDIDSLSLETQGKFGPEKIHKIADQETTDFEKALAHIACPLSIGVGFLGGRADHQLSAMRALAQAPHRNCILLSGDDIIFRAPQHLVMPAPKSTRVSLFPFAEARVDARGLKWPLNDAAMSMAQFTSQSNETSSDLLEMHTFGHLAVIMPAQLLGAAIEVLTRSRQIT